VAGRRPAVASFGWLQLVVGWPWLAGMRPSVAAC